MNSLVTGGMFPDFINNGGGTLTSLKAKFSMNLINNTATAINTSISDNAIQSYNWSVYHFNTIIKTSIDDNIMFPVSLEGPYNITLTVVDSIGNSDTCSSNIIYDIEEIANQSLSGGFAGGAVHSFPIIELKKIEEKDIKIDITFLGV